MPGRTIISVDMDAFFAAVEVRDNPDLAGKPLIIGALPSERGVVSTCSYEARKFGVHSAMSIKEAYRRCPHGIYMHPNGQKYVEASRLIHGIWANYTDLVECVSLDEGYLDVTGSEHLFGGAERIAWEIKCRTREEVRLTCSVGIGYSMMTAKLASEEKKPDGYFEIRGPEALRALIIDRGVRVLWGVGIKTAQLLERAGIHTVRDIYTNREGVVALLGNQGRGLLALADGIDERRVTPYADPKSIGKEHTFQKDITDFRYLQDMLRLISRELSYEFHERELFGSTITLKITFADMRQITRSRTGEATNRAEDFYAVAASLLGAVERRPIRLVGLSISGLAKTRTRQVSLTDDAFDERLDKLDDVTFRLQKRYGTDAIKTGSALESEKRLGTGTHTAETLWGEGEEREGGARNR